MIKHFNTALSAGTASGTSKKGGGMGTIILVGLLLVGGYFAYRYITKRNQPVKTQDED
jgi:hypothetical protein